MRALADSDITRFHEPNYKGPLAMPAQRLGICDACVHSVCRAWWDSLCPLRGLVSVTQDGHLPAPAAVSRYARSEAWYL